jgi:hypothetical protein
MIAILIASVAAVVVATVLAVSSLVNWGEERWIVSRSEERSARIIKDQIGSDQAANLMKSAGRVDVKFTEALTLLIESLAETNQAVIQVGNTLLIKDSGKVSTRTLTSRDLRYLERHPDLLENPSDILRVLDDPTSPLGGHSSTTLSPTNQVELVEHVVTRVRWSGVVLRLVRSSSPSCGTVQSGDGLLRSRTGWGCRRRACTAAGFSCPVL